MSICSAKCNECYFKENCKGCESTCGKPFGGSCIAAEYIKLGGKEAYDKFKNSLLDEINGLLKSNGLPEADGLNELPGNFVNLSYPIPSGEEIKMLDDTKVYLGTQIEFGNMGVCYGVVADTSFILVCSYGINGSDPELLIYKKR